MTATATIVGGNDDAVGVGGDDGEGAARFAPADEAQVGDRRVDGLAVGVVVRIGAAVGVLEAVGGDDGAETGLEMTATPTLGRWR